MLKVIKEFFKIMGKALTFANVGEMLREDQKAAILNQHKEESCLGAPGALPPRIVLATNDEISIGVLDQAIALCHKKNAKLDLLCVSTVGNPVIAHLATAQSRLHMANDLDFQVTRRNGELFVVTEDYVHARQDTLMLLVNVSENLRKRLSDYHRVDKWTRTRKYPAVTLIDDHQHT